MQEKICSNNDAKESTVSINSNDQCVCIDMFLHQSFRL